MPSCPRLPTSPSTTSAGCSLGYADLLYTDMPPQTTSHNNGELYNLPQELASPSTSQVIPQPLADLAGLFGGEERDPIDPFTLYGSTR